MICLNPTCENHQKDLGLTKFCPECGQKTANPEPQSLTCPAPGCSNEGKDLGRMKFCSECGTTTVAGVSAAQKSTALGFAPRASTEGMQLPSGYAAYQGGSGRSIIAGDQNITHSTVVHNQDPTKQVRQCAVSGRQAEVTRGHVCPACGLWVHEDYYVRALMRCDHCSTAQAKLSNEKFKGKVQQFLTDGVITKEELSELRSLGGNLGLSVPEQDTIISQLKQEMLSNNSAQRPMTLIDQSRRKAVLRAVENKVFSTDPVAGRVHLDSLRVLHKSYPDDETIACLLVFILSEEMINDPAVCLTEIERVLNTSCFAHDTPRKYLTRAVFYRRGTLLGQAKAPHSDGQGNWAGMLEQFGEALREAAAALESMFPNSEECHALQVAMMIDSYLLSGDETIREDVNLLLEGAASVAGHSDVGIAIKAAHANAIEGLEWGDDREMTIGQGLARGYFSDLFSLNLLTLLKMMEGVDEGDGEHGDQDITSIEDTHKLANRDDAEAQFQMGLMYELTEGEQKNNVEAVRCYLLAAQQGHADAQNKIGNLFARGSGVAKNYAKAMAWYQHAANQGHTGALSNLGRLHEFGLVTPTNYNKAVKFYQEAADKGCASGSFRLSLMYLYGKGVTQNNAEAVRWLSKAAGQGHACAQLSLGLAYSEGVGLEKDDAEAVKWFRHSAAHGNADAQNGLGRMYSLGRGVKQSDDEALKWFSLAAKQGNAAAQHNISERGKALRCIRYKSLLGLHAEGCGVEIDDFDDEDYNFEMEEESMIGNQIPQATLIPQATPVVGVYSPIPPPLPVKATITQPAPICVPHKSASKDDLQYRLNQLLASFSTSKRIHVPPKIPKQKLFGAQMTFLPKDEEVILLVDNSLLGGTPFALCQEGFAITREGICGKGVISNKLSIKIADIYSTGYNEPNIWINGKIFVELAMLTHAEISKILEIVQIYVDLLKQ